MQVRPCPGERGEREEACLRERKERRPCLREGKEKRPCLRERKEKRSCLRERKERGDGKRFLLQLRKN